MAVWQSHLRTDESHDKIFCNLALVQTQSILRKWKMKPSNIINTDSLELMVRLVAEGLGYGIIPARAVALLKTSRCERVPNTPIYYDKISVVYRPEFGKHPDERLLIDCLKRSLQ